MNIQKWCKQYTTIYQLQRFANRPTERYLNGAVFTGDDITAHILLSWLQTMNKYINYFPLLTKSTVYIYLLLARVETTRM